MIGSSGIWQRQDWCLKRCLFRHTGRTVSCAGGGTSRKFVTLFEWMTQKDNQRHETVIHSQRNRHRSAARRPALVSSGRLLRVAPHRAVDAAAVRLADDAAAVKLADGTASGARAWRALCSPGYRPLLCFWPVQEKRASVPLCPPWPSPGQFALGLPLISPTAHGSGLLHAYAETHWEQENTKNLRHCVLFLFGYHTCWSSQKL